MTAQHNAASAPRLVWDEGMAFKLIVGERTPGNELLALIAERIRVAARHLKLSREDLHTIFSCHSIFEGETQAADKTAEARGFIMVETLHVIQGKVGKGALKIVFPKDLLTEGPLFRDAGAGAVEIAPPEGKTRWETEREAEEVVKQAMREFMTGESLSMSLKCQATGAPFCGSEGLILCAHREFNSVTGRYLLKPVLQGDVENAAADKEIIEFMMNSTSEILTRANRIAHDKIVHAAETNSTLTSRLTLQLPTNVVEGHLRTLLLSDPKTIIGDEDMTARLRELLVSKNYRATDCALARSAAQMQMEHAILLPGSRDRLRHSLSQLPKNGSPSPAQYRGIIDIFFGTGEVQQNEDQLYHHRESILRSLSIALSARRLDECGASHVLAWYIKTLLDNQRIMVEATAVKKLPPGGALPLNWFHCPPLLDPEDEERLWTLLREAEHERVKVKDGFWKIVNILSEARARIPGDTVEPLLQARSEVLEHAIRAITSTDDVIPSVDRLVFFTMPFTYECATPKLGVVTRKPIAVCGSELRPEAMAVAAVMSIEIFLKKLTHHANPLKGMTVAIEGLGNAGKNVARIMVTKGATIVGVSDSKGVALKPGGFDPKELKAIIEHKSSGHSLNTFYQSPAAQGLPRHPGTSLTLYPDPQLLKKMKADILVLTAIPGSIHEGNASELPVSLVCELTGAAVTGAAKTILQERQVHVIPDNLASSGGLLVSLSEMLQNSAGQMWDRKLEEYNLADQLSRSFDAAMLMAQQYHVDVPTGSDILALQRMHELAIYRIQLETLSQLLEQRLRKIHGAGPVFVVADDDEDGTASAAIMQELIVRLNPGVVRNIVYLNESLRSEMLLELINEQAEAGTPVSHVFVVDRAFPLNEPGQSIAAKIAAQCGLTLINNHTLPDPPTEGGTEPTGPRPKMPVDLGVLHISPQTLRATVPARDFPTAMVLKEVAHQLITDEPTLTRIDWQAAVGSYLDTPAEVRSEWLLFFAQFNTDKMLEAARAVRTVTRAGGFSSAIAALSGVQNPDQLETNTAWGRFMAEYHSLDERVQVLVEKILLENRRKPFTAHFFSHDEVASPTPIAGNDLNELDFHQWISEHLTKRGNLAEKPIIVGQVVQGTQHRRYLGVRIRSPRGVDLMEVGLPESFKTGGLPNTAIARLPLDAILTPEQQFHQLVDDIWMKATNPIYLGTAAVSSGSADVSFS